MEIFCGHMINHQARAVLAYLSGHDGIEASWSHDRGQYLARPTVAEWHNCRERGYVISMRAGEYTGPQINIAFFEHRNSDAICAVEWVQDTLNPPTIDTADFGGKIYRDKYDVSHRVSAGRADQMADWICNRLERHWKDHNAYT